MARDGRDHHIKAFMMAGAGIKPGITYGGTDEPGIVLWITWYMFTTFMQPCFIYLALITKNLPTDTRVETSDLPTYTVKS